MNRKTNVEMVTELMDFSRNGALQQAFILTAIQRYAEAVIKTGAGPFDNPMINGEGWVRCAQEALDTVHAHLGTTPKVTTNVDAAPITARMRRKARTRRKARKSR